MKDYLNRQSGEVIGAGIEGHSDSGTGLLESNNELSFQHELKIRGIESVRQVALSIKYRDLVVPEAYRIDLLVETLLPIHTAQLLTYLRMPGNHLGLLMNFHTVRLTEGIKHLVHNFPS